MRDEHDERDDDRREVPPIAAPGTDLASGTTHGVAPGESERPGPARGERPGDGAAVGIGGAVAGDPIRHEHDPAVPPGRHVSPPPIDDDPGGGTG